MESVSISRQTRPSLPSRRRTTRHQTTSGPRGKITTKSIILATKGYTSYLLSQFTPLIRYIQAQMSPLIPTHPASLNLIPHSYGFEGVGSMDRATPNYLVQSPYISDVQSGHLEYGGGRCLALYHGENACDDSFIDKHVESYLRTLPDRLNLPLLTHHTSRSEQTQKSPLDIAASWTGIIGQSADGYP
jgi:glycine/D-amino acid oxidase-like deaminating enzyme